MVCKEGYFGPDCGCSPRNDSTGHFTCDENGTIVCLPGYQNTATNCVEEEVITPDPTTNTETISETPTNTPTINFLSKNIIESTQQTVQTSNTLYSIEPSFTSSNNVTVSMTGINDGTNDGGGVTEPQSVLPIAVGGAVGGLVVLLIILILIIILWIIKQKKKNKNYGDES